MTQSEEDFELLRGDLIAYLSRKLDVPSEDVLIRLGDLLVDPVPEEIRERYERVIHARRPSG